MIDSNTKVLLVDDYDLVLAMLRKALNGLGITKIEEAKNGSEALESLKKAHEQKDPFGAVFLDWNMPKMSGIELLQICRNDPVFKKLPIIMVTAEAEKKQILQALKLGATDYIVKPCSPESLSRKIQHINNVLSRKAG